MYSSRGNNAYGQQQQQQTKPQPYSSHLGPDGASQISMASRHPALLGGHSSAGAHYGGQYTSVYGSSALNSALQVPATSAKGAGSSVFEGRSGYGSTMQDSPKYTSENYPAANQKYGSKGEKMFSDDRLTYAERSSAYSGRDLQTESTVRLADSLAFGHPHQADIYDRLDAASALRKELLDGSSRQGDYLAARAATVRQELLPYGARMDAADLHTLSMISGTQHPPSILGAAPRRDMEDLVYTHTSATPGYGVSLPPGRAYASAKSLHGTSLDSDYPGGILARAGYARLDDRKDDVEYAREIERREEDRRREILRDRERDRERDRDRERERKRERERERDRERERERKRRREHERDLERREKEREAKRGSEIRRDRSPLRSSRDRGRSSSAKARRSLRRESPVKEKRREYVCKVYSSNLVDPERDYLSMDKRYPRLYVSPECSKVVVNWSREDLKVPFNTPISFEHDFVQEEIPSEPDSASKKISDGHVKLENGATRWNAKVLLMSGLSHNAWEELSSERKFEDRIPHLCNMLRFAFLKDGSSCMAIGGSWDTVDGNDPTVDKSTLVQTVLRYAKELTGLDLKNCRHWNPFLEIHYDRVGKDGLFSHKEVTVLYIPDLSDCLPSIDAWRDQWLAHKKAIAERERLHALKREKLREKKEVPKDKETKDIKNPEKKKEAGSGAKVDGKGKVGTKVKAKEAGKERDKTVIEKKDGDKTIIEKKDGDKTVIEKKDEVETADEGNKPGKKNLTDNTDVQTPGSGKKIIRKVIKKKVVAEKDGAGNTEVIGEDAESFATPTKKKATKKAPVVKTVKKEDEVKEPECSDVKEKNEDVVGASVKTTVKKKIIKRVAKKKIAAKDFNNKDKVANENETGLTIGKQTTSEVKLENNESVSEAVPHNVVPEQRKDVGGSSEVGNKSEKIQVKEEKKAKVEGSGSDKNAKSKDVKEKKDEDVKTETRVKDVKDKKKTEDPPRHPGLILQTKGSKYSKLRSLSLSLDSLLDYTDKDIEESTFELSVFAETFYEMLQYLMGSRILKFLQKLRIKFVSKRNQKKRQREEVSDKKEKGKERTSGKKSSPKRQKTEDATVKSKSVKTETMQEGDPTDEKTVKDEKMLIDNVENPKPEDGSENDEDPEEEVEEVVEEEEAEEEEEVEEEAEEEEEEEEDPEEDPEEDENMADANPKNDVENEEKAEVEKKVNMDEKSENVDEKVKDGQEEKAKVTVDPDTKSEAEKKEKKENRKVDTKKKETQLDKQLLEAFRFFDRNRVGYIRVEDLRLILHALGNCMSHRDAKELVQSALLESNTGRDDRILYNKLVKMNDI